MSGILGTSHSKSKVLGGSQDTIKAWVHFNGNGTIAIQNSFNVSSLTDDGTGLYKMNFATPMTNDNWSMSGTIGDWDSVVTSTAPNINYAAVYSLHVPSHVMDDKNYIMAQIVGD